MKALLDTSFLVALANSKDINHEQVVKTIQTVKAELYLPVTVLPEACYLIGSRLGHHAMRRFVRSMLTQSLVLESLTANDLARTVKILDEYAESRLDFVDASIIALAERHNIIHVFTLDRRDFSIIRPQHTPFLEILP